MRELLDLPDRTVKPRQDGITHVLDKGLSVAEVDGLIEVAGDSVDIVKLGWGTALATGNLGPKLERYRAHGIPVVLGGTLTELAIARGRFDELIDWAKQLGLQHFEISDGTIALEHDGDQTRLTYTEQAVHFDGLDSVEGREEGTRGILDQLGSYLASGR